MKEIDAFINFEYLASSLSPLGFKKYSIGVILEEVLRCHAAIKSVQGN
jgi:hypothetical protein